MGKLFLSVLLLGALLLTSCQSIPAPEPNVETAPTPSIQAVEVEPTEAVVTPEPTQGSPEAEDSNEAAAPVGGSAIQGSAIDDILSALLKLRDQQSFRVETTLTYDDYTETSLVEIVNPDRMRLISEDFEMIIIGDTMYVYDEGQWLEFPRMVENMDNLLLMVTDEDVEELRGGILDAQYVGEEMLDGERTRVYQFSVYDEEFDTYGEVKMWIAASDGLPRRVESIPTGEEELLDDGYMVNVYKDFNTQISIEPPE
jgi:hypothetical protein